MKLFFCLSTNEWIGQSFQISLLQHCLCEVKNAAGEVSPADVGIPTACPYSIHKPSGWQSIFGLSQFLKSIQPPRLSLAFTKKKVSFFIFF